MFWRLTPLEAYGNLPEPEIDNEVKTPKGRQQKRGANTPLTNEIVKKTNMGPTPENSQI